MDACGRGTALMIGGAYQDFASETLMFYRSGAGADYARLELIYEGATTHSISVSDWPLAQRQAFRALESAV